MALLLKNTQRKMTGKIKFYKTDKHFGFIIEDLKLEDIFFHKLELKDGYVPRLEEKVKFDIGEYKGMKVAKNVEKLIIKDIEDGTKAQKKQE